MSNDAIPASLVREELARLVDSDGMRRAPSHRRLLAYLVDKALDGDTTALRESAIAFAVFRRDPASFDATVDPIVRVTTRRLRERLDAHYAHQRPAPRLRFRLPKGGYRLEFLAPRRSTDAAVGIAVQTTRNVTGDATFDACCATFADRIADSLARAGMPRVVARASVLEAEAHVRGPARLVQELGVNWLVESTLTREHKNDLRLSVRMVGAPDMSVQWVESLIAGDQDVYGLTDRTLDATVLRVQASVMGGDPGADGGVATSTRTLPASARTRLDAVRLLLLQRTIARTDEALDIALSLTTAFPDVADCWAWRAAAHYSRMSFRDRDSAPALDEIRLSAARALALDADHPVALRTRAIVLGRADGDADGAEALFRHALRAMPHYTSARLNFAELLALHGRGEEAQAQLNLALIYDPLSVTVHLARAACLSYLRRYDDAREAWTLCRAGGESSEWLLVGEGTNELAAGNLELAHRLLAEALQRFPASPATQMAMAHIHAASGHAAPALALEAACIARYPDYSPAQRAVLHALLGKRERALELIAIALAGNDIVLQSTLIDPAFDGLADDPRFRAACASRGLRRRAGARPGAPRQTLAADVG